MPNQLYTQTSVGSPVHLKSAHLHFSSINVICVVECVAWANASSCRRWFFCKKIVWRLLPIVWGYERTFFCFAQDFIIYQTQVIYIFNIPVGKIAFSFSGLDTYICLFFSFDNTLYFLTFIYLCIQFIYWYYFLSHNCSRYLFENGENFLFSWVWVYKCSCSVCHRIFY